MLTLFNLNPNHRLLVSCTAAKPITDQFHTLLTSVLENDDKTILAQRHFVTATVAYRSG